MKRAIPALVLALLVPMGLSTPPAVAATDHTDAEGVSSIHGIVRTDSPHVTRQAVLEVGPGKAYATLQLAIDAAVSGDTISLAGNYEHNGTRVTVDDTMTIDGNGVTINGGFDFTGGADVVVNNMTISGITGDANWSSQSSQGATGEKIVVSVLNGSRLTGNNFDITQTGLVDANLVAFNLNSGGTATISDSTITLIGGNVFGFYLQNGTVSTSINDVDFNFTPQRQRPGFNNQNGVIFGTQVSPDGEWAKILAQNYTLNFTSTAGAGVEQRPYKLQAIYSGATGQTRTQVLSWVASNMKEEEQARVYYSTWINEYVPPVTNISKGTLYPTIQTAIDAAASGNTIEVAPGNYAEPLTVSKSLHLVGSVDASGEATSLLPMASDQNGITVSADDVTIQNVKLQQATPGTRYLYGITFGPVEDLSLSNVTVDGAQVGLRVGSGAGVDGLTITNSHFDNNVQGWYLTEPGTLTPAPSTVGNGTDVRNVFVTNTTFNGNTQKGLYAEKLSNATFDGITVSSSGTDPSYGFNNGIDINLKWQSYSTITIKNSSITNSGFKGSATNPLVPAAVTIKARDDATGYCCAPEKPPATLTGVTIENTIIQGPENALRLGEAGKVNKGPLNVSIINSSLIGDDSSGTTGYSLINSSDETTSTNGNWWGTADLSLIQNDRVSRTPGQITLGSWITKFTRDPSKAGQPGFWALVQDANSTTPAGSNVDDTFSGLPNGGQVVVQFATVTTAGITTVEPFVKDDTTPSPPVAPSGFSLGDSPIYYTITTTATITGPIELCFAYDAAAFGGTKPTVYHFTSNQWFARETSIKPGSPPQACASVNSFSRFALGVPIPPPPPPAPTFPPSAPRDLAGTGGDARITATWAAPAETGSFPVTSYQVEALPGGASCLVAAPTLTCTITGLTNGSAYTLRARALNGAGWSAWSDASAPVTPRAGVPGAPSNVTAVAGNGEVVVTWTAPAEVGASPITGYRVEQSRAGGAWTVAIADTGSTGAIATVTGLVNGDSYRFRVAAINAAGVGVVSLPSAPVTPEDPEQPSILITGERVRIQGKTGVRVRGETTGLGEGAVLRPWVRLPGQTAFTRGSARILVDTDGAFTWERKTGKKVTVYIQAGDGTRSNRVVIPAR